MGQLLTQKKVIEAKKANMPNDIARAIGRISGGLYVVTATKGSSKGAMVASWVSQVSGDLLAFFPGFSDLTAKKGSSKGALIISWVSDVSESCPDMI